MAPWPEILSMRFLIWQIITCSCIGLVFAVPVAMNLDGIREEPALRFLVYTYSAAALLFFALAGFLAIVYARRRHEPIRDVLESAEEARESLREQVFDRDYSLFGRPKAVAFSTLFWGMLFLAYLAATMLGSRIIGGPLFFAFNSYNAIMFISLAIGVALLWRMNPNGYFILWGVCLYNIIRIVIGLRFSELLIWLYPVASLLQLWKYYK